MAGSLVPVRERIDWARERFDQLNVACDKFVRQEPDGSSAAFAIKLNREAGSLEFRNRLPKDFPSSLTRLVGEVLFHLRGSLDYLAWQLVLANGQTPGNQTEFPVYKDSLEFDRRAPGKTRGMSTTAKAAIKRLQPFEAWPERPDQATIWKIHDLNVIDKHRLPHLACFWFASMLGSAQLGPTSRVDFRHKRGCMEDDALLLRLRWDPKSPLPDEVQVKVNFTFDIAIRNPGQVEFVTDRDQTVEAVPIRHLFNVAFDYMETTLLPSFEAEFA